MKKIVLGCAAVLLSLGLLAGCNNKEDEPPITEAVSLSVSQTSVNLEPGSSAEVTYTVSPEKATVMALSDHEEYVTAVAQNGTIYLEAVAAGTAIVSVGAEYEDYASAEAQITVTVAEVLEPEPAEPVITLSVDSKLNLFEDGDTATIVPVVTPAEADIDFEITDVEFTTDPEPAEDAYVISVEETAEGFVVTPGAQGTANIVFTASLEGYDDVTATTAVTVHETGWEPEPITDVTLSITLEYQGETVTSIPDYVDLYILGTWKNENMDSLSDAELLTQGEGCVFTLQLSESLEAGAWYNYKIYAAYTEESGEDTTLEWSHCLYSSGNGYFQVDENVTSGSTLNLVAEIEVDPATVLGNPSVGPFTNYTIHFYFTNGSTYYTLPDYADAYLTGDLFKSGSDWTYGDTTKLTAGTDGSGNTYYSYTFDEIEAGAHTLAIYLEYNLSAPSGVQVAVPSWGHQYGYNFSYTVENSATSESENDYVLEDGDPADYIADPNQTCDVTIALANSDSNSASTTPKIKGTFDGWAAEHSFTVDGSGYKYTIESVIGNDVEFGVYTDSSWNDHLVVTNTGSGLSMSGSDIVIDGSYVTGDLTLTLTFDFGLFGQGSAISATGAITYAQ